MSGSYIVTGDVVVIVAEVEVVLKVCLLLNGPVIFAEVTASAAILAVTTAPSAIVKAVAPVTSPE